MSAPNLPKVVDAAYIADRLTLEAEKFRSLLRTGCLTPGDAGRLAEDVGRFCLDAATAVRTTAGTSPASEPATSQAKCDEWFGRLTADTLFWD
jgi:hypothetical protein